MTYDDLSILKSFSEAHVLPYPLLRDEEVRHVMAFDILNKDYVPGDRGYGIPYPGIMYLDADQMIRAKFADEGYKRRPALTAVYERLKAEVAE
jgi:peroxiredoxin